MEISFASKKLERCARNPKIAQREWGDLRTKIFFKRITALYAAQTFNDLRNVPGRFHELTENRRGQWSCDLDQPYRLIITPVTDTNSVGGGYSNKAVIVEIINYHKEK